MLDFHKEKSLTKKEVNAKEYFQKIYYYIW